MNNVKPLAPQVPESIWREKMPRTISHYRDMEHMNPGSGMLREVRWQYKDMANGGDGGDLGFEENGQRSCRGINYLGYPDQYFREVCDMLGWDR